MRKRYFLLLSLFIFTLRSLGEVGPVYAHTYPDSHLHCQASLTPTSGPSNTSFVLTLAGCVDENNPGASGFQIRWEVVDPLTGNVLAGNPFSTDLSGNAVISISSFTTTSGDFQINITETMPIPVFNQGSDQPVSFTVTITGIVSARCCFQDLLGTPEFCTVAVPNCDIVPPNYLGCPTTCPSVHSNGCNIWTCSGSGSFSSIGPKIFCVPPPVNNPTSTITDRIFTALGCLPYDTKPFVTKILNIATGTGGGIAILVLLYAGLQMATASGDPKKVQAAKELISSALVGLAFITLAILIVNFIGYNVLGLQNFGFQQ